MSIRRRETKAGVRYDVQWRLPDRSKRKKTFVTERAAKQFAARLVTSSATGESLDPRGGKTELESVYRSWIASRPDLSAKVRRIRRKLDGGRSRHQRLRRAVGRRLPSRRARQCKPPATRRTRRRIAPPPRYLWAMLLGASTRRFPACQPCGQQKNHFPALLLATSFCTKRPISLCATLSS